MDNMEVSLESLPCPTYEPLVMTAEIPLLMEEVQEKEVG
jgi:hypothetical protein